MNAGDVNAGDYEYVYDPFGRRVKAVEDGATRYFVYDGLDCVAELNGSKTLDTYYTRGLGLGGGIGDIIAEWKPSATNWYSYNHRGDVTLLTANGGRVTNRLEYTAFGSLSTVNYQLSTRSIGFSSKEYDAKSGLSYYGFRYYDAASGRWMTTEPSGYDGPNLYRFVMNGPIMIIDIFGLFGDGYNGRSRPGQFRGHSDFYGHSRFDFTKEDHNENSWTRNPAAHFQDYDTSMLQVLNAMGTCSKERFESGMHRLQDFYSHYNKGYRWPDTHGHFWDGTAPDKDNDAWREANRDTKQWVDIWDAFCCKCGNTYNARSKGPCED